MAWRANSAFLVEVPRRGGTITEGVIGLPRFINPVLAVTDSDKDLSALVYSGLMHQMPDGSLVPNLAESYSISEDKTTYTFILKPDIYFHDGTRVTTDDIEFTIAKIQDPVTKSAKRANWDGVVIEKVNEREIKFKLRQPYAPFLRNTTMGILPKHAWSEIDSEQFTLHQLNTHPIGSGPYKIKSVEQDKGMPTLYTLQAFNRYALGKPLIKSIIFKFFVTEKELIGAYSRGEVMAINSFSPDSAETLAEDGIYIQSLPLPRVFGIFFNTTENKALADRSVRQALNSAVDKQRLVDIVLRGYGVILDGPVPAGFIGETPLSTSTPEENIAAANALLEKNDWKLNANGIREKKIDKETVPLTFSISTSDAPELKEVAELVKADWKKIGIDVNVKVFEGGNLNQNVIRPRKYEALLFGQVVNRDLDLLAFWHSDQVQDPGLNIALYSNSEIDSILEKLRTISDPIERGEVYLTLLNKLQLDMPAVFLYSPHFIYIAPGNVKGLTLGPVHVPSDRFANIHEWYIYTDHVWDIFEKN